MAECRLPGEIIGLICFQLRPKDQERHLSCDIHEDQENLSTLKNIALASKLCYRVSLPAMFHTLHFGRHGGIRWYTLLNELFRCPHKAQLVKRIRFTDFDCACLSTRDDEDELGAFYANVTRFRHLLQWSEYAWNSLLEVQGSFEYAILICLCNDLRWLETSLGPLRSQGTTLETVLSLSSKFSGAERTVKILKQLEAYKSPEYKSEWDTNDVTDMTVSDHGLKILDGIASIQRMTLHGYKRIDPTDPSAGDIVGAFSPWCRHLEHFGLSMSCGSTSDLQNIFASLPSLKSFSICDGDLLWDTADLSPDLDQGSIGGEIVKYSPNIERIACSMTECYTGDCQPLNPFSDISGLGSLKCLYISIQCLREDTDGLDELTLVPLHEILPSSLQRLAVHRGQDDELLEQARINVLTSNFMLEAMKMMTLRTPRRTTWKMVGLVRPR